ncbi:hypothetical protein AB0P15_18885 [Streptomyces sp. NPDC087917]|uniref:hypothetical protein n=1 Tax=Streptomyces sp. NPDC087917 TaxID=3155060 RepID=UPI003432012E
MHGPGIPPQQGPQGHRPVSSTTMTLRVLFTALPVLSCGFFAWGSLVRLAVLTRKGSDWALMVFTALLFFVWIAFIEADPTADTSGWQGNVGAGGTLLTGFAVAVYYLVADIKHHERAALVAVQVHGAAPWYPAQQTPYGQQQTGPAYGYPPAGTTAPVPPQVPQTPPHHTPPPRIGQVRAELDELSELLRRQPPAGPPQPGGPYRDPNNTSVQDPNQ